MGNTAPNYNSDDNSLELHSEFIRDERTDGIKDTLSLKNTTISGFLNKDTEALLLSTINQTNMTMKANIYKNDNENANLITDCFEDNYKETEAEEEEMQSGDKQMNKEKLQLEEFINKINKEPTKPKLYFIYSIDANESEFFFIQIKNEKYIFDELELNSFKSTKTNITYITKLYVTICPNQTKTTLMLVSNLKQTFYSQEITINPLQDNYLFNINFSNKVSLFKLFTTKIQSPRSFALTEYEQFQAYLTCLKKIEQTPNKLLLENTLPFFISNDNVIHEEFYLTFFDSIINEEYSVELFKYFSVESYIQTIDKGRKELYDKIIKKIIPDNSVLRTQLNSMNTTSDSKTLINKFNLTQLFYLHKTSDAQLDHYLRNYTDVVMNFIDLLSKVIVIRSCDYKHLTLKQIDIIIPLITTLSQLQNVFRLCKTNDLLIFINSHNALINDYFRNTTLKLSLYISPLITDDLQSMIECICTNDYLLESFIDKSDLKELLKMYIVLYAKTNLFQLNFIEQFAKLNNCNELISEIHQALFITELHLIITSSTKSNTYILKFLSEEKYKENREQLNEQKWRSIGEAMKLETMTDKEVNLFHSIQFNDITKQCYCSFIKGLISTVSNIKNYKSIFKVILIENQYIDEFFTPMRNLLFELIIQNNEKTIQNNIKDNADECIFQAIISFNLLLFNTQNYFNMVKVIDDLYYSLDPFLVVSITLYCLDDDDLEEGYKREIAMNVINKLNNNTCWIAIALIVKLTNENLVTFILKTMTQSDKTNELLIEMRRILNNIDLNTFQLEQFVGIDKAQLQKRITLLYLSDEDNDIENEENKGNDKGIEVVQKLNEIIDIVSLIQNGLIGVIKHYLIFHKTSKYKLDLFKNSGVVINKTLLFTLFPYQEEYLIKNDSLYYNALTTGRLFSFAKEKNKEFKTVIELFNQLSIQSDSNFPSIINNSNEEEDEQQKVLIKVKEFIGESINKNQTHISLSMIDYFIEDYYKLFISSYFQIYQSDVIEFIIVSLSFQPNQKGINKPFITLKNNIEYLSNNDFIIKQIITIFISLSKFKPDLLNNIIESKKSIDMPIKNLAIFGIEALIRNAILDELHFQQLSQNSMNNYVEALTEILSIAKMISINLKFTSISLKGLDLFVSLCNWMKEFFGKLNNENKEIYVSFIEIIKQKQKRFSSLLEVNLISDLFEDLHIFEDLFFHATNCYSKYILILLDNLEQYSSVKYDKYEAEIMKIILMNNNLIKESTQLINYFFRNYRIEPKLPNEKENKDISNELFPFNNTESKALDLLNYSNNVAEEFLLFYFQKAIEVYFDKQTNNKDKILGISLNYFEVALNYITSINKSPKKMQKLNLLYSISFVKVYLLHYVDISFHYPSKNLSQIDQVIINCPSPFRTVIQIYILKLLLKYVTYDELNQMNFNEKCSMTWIKAFLEKPAKEAKSTSNALVDHYFISITQAQTESKKSILSFFDSSFTSTLNSYKTKTDISCISMISNFPINNSIKEYLYLLFDSNKYRSLFLPKINEKHIEMWLYCYRLCLLCLNAPKSWYHSIFNTELLSNFNKAFVPGAEIEETIRVTSALEVEDLLKNYVKEGIYICSCGLYYQIMNCQNTQVISTCGNCNLEIGGIKHSMVKREGHVRVFLEEVYKKIALDWASYDSGYWGEKFDKVHIVNGKEYVYHKDYITLDQLKSNILTHINNEATKGIVLVSFGFFSREHKWMREMNQVSYRLLSLILYSLLHFGNMLKYITDAQLKTILAPNTNCLDYIYTNWEELTIELLKININNPYIFLNMIFDDLEKVISQHQVFDTKDKRAAFETAINVIVTNAKDKYSSFVSNYKKKNSELLKYDIHSIKSLVNELESPILYSQEEYPYFKYFMIDNCLVLKKVKEDLANNPQLSKECPILTNYLSQREKIQTLSNLNSINSFANYMLHQYSNVLNREQIKSVSFKQFFNIKKNNKLVLEKYTAFEKAWNDIKIKDRRYGCVILNDVVITENESIANALNDDGVGLLGMNLASFYQFFIEYQNDFLSTIAATSSNSPQCAFYKESVSKKIKIQNAKEDNIVSLDINKSNSPFSSFEELVNCYAQKDCFDNNWNINYSNYSSMTINYSQIEKALQDAILPGKRLFDTKQRFVNYEYEGCRGENTSMITDYLTKYSQIELTNLQKELLYRYASDINPSSSTNNKNIFTSLPILLLYIFNNNYNENDSINTIVNSIPFVINYQCKSFFITNAKFTVNQLIKVYEYFEHLCFPEILKNIDVTHAQDQLPNESKKAIESYFIKVDNKKGSIVNKLTLATATRRFISRMLAGKRARNDINATLSVFEYLENSEYWPESVAEKPEFEEEFKVLKSSFRSILSCYAVSLYYFLGGDKGLLKQL